jgi:two-component system, sensor histidine kinase LadS
VTRAAFARRCSIRPFCTIAAFLLMVVFIPFTRVVAAESRVVDLGVDEAYYEPLVRKADYLLDHTRALDITDIIVRENEFRPIATKYPDFGLTKWRVWLKATVVNNTGRSGPWRVNVNRQYLESLRIDLVAADGAPVEVMAHTDNEPFSARPVVSTLLAQDISIPAGSTTDLYFAYTSTSTTFLPIGVGTPEAVVSLHAAGERTDNFLNGALFAMIALAVIMTPFVGWKISVNFAAYIFVAGLYVFNADGYTFRYLWPTAPWLNDRMNLALMLGMSALALSFVRKIFDFHGKAPRFDRLLLGASGTAGIFAVLALPLIEFRPFMTAAYAFVPVCASLQAASGVVAFRKQIAGATPYLVGGVFVIASFASATIAHIVPGRFNLDATLDFGHITVVVECFVFATAIMLRMLQIRRERDAALKSELKLAQKQLALSHKLREREKDYDRARMAARRNYEQLSAVSHDLQQPLMSLRAGLSRLGARDEHGIEQMHTAFDYLENLARRQLPREGMPPATSVHGGAQIEEFDINAILENVYAMFRGEAEENGVSLRVDRLSAPVRSDPVLVMRVVSNLLSNAIRHSSGGAVRVNARDVGDFVEIEIEDNGTGMDETMLNAAMRPYEKGTHSQGSGLGLAIVREASDLLDLEFAVRSALGEGTACRIRVRKVQS